MPPSEAHAKSAFKTTRKFYESGLKSANKDYDVANASWWKQLSGKASSRHRTQPRADVSLGVQRSSQPWQAAGGLGDTIEQGRLMVVGNLQAANCYELACVSCYHLHSVRGVPRNQLAVVGVYGGNFPGSDQGADHAFCIYGSADMLLLLSTTPAFQKLTYIDGARALRGEVYAIDPWANTLCWFDQYTQKMAEKVASWGSYGKRILWVWETPPGSNNYATQWVNPDGVYGQVFGRASFSVSICP